MPAALMGAKRRCLTCSAAFFDLNRSPILCPKCGAAFQIVELPRNPTGLRQRTPRFAVSPRVEPDEGELETADKSGDEASIPEIEDEEETGLDQIDAAIPLTDDKAL